MRKTKYFYICYARLNDKQFVRETLYKTLLFITSKELNDIYIAIGINLKLEKDYNSFVKPIANHFTADIFGNALREGSVNIYVI